MMKGNPLDVTIRIYKEKRVILYIGCEVVYYWGSLSLIETPLVNTILSNSVIFSLTVYIGCEFPMRPFLPNLHSFDSVWMEINSNDTSNDNNNDNFITQERAPGMEIPLFPKDSDTLLSSNI